MPTFAGSRSRHKAGSTAADVPAPAGPRHAELSEQLNDAACRYYVADAPTLSDADYDARMRELQALEDEFPELRTPDRPASGSPVTTPRSSRR